MGLKALGFEPGDKVSILGDNCREWLYADIAAQSLHGIAVGIYPTDVARQVKYILKNSDSKFVVTRDQEQVDKVLQVKNELPFLKKVIAIDMKGLRRYKDPLITSFDEMEKRVERYTSRCLIFLRRASALRKPKMWPSLFTLQGLPVIPRGR